MEWGTQYFFMCGLGILHLVSLCLWRGGVGCGRELRNIHAPGLMYHTSLFVHIFDMFLRFVNAET